MHNKLKQSALFSNAKSTISIPRSGHDLSFGHHTSMNAGKLYPIFCKEVLAGDTFSVNTSFVNRFASPLQTPTMDTAFFDIWFFNVPQRLVWEHTKEFYGENNESAWTPDREYFIPQLNLGLSGFQPDGVGDRMGIPTLAPNLPVNALPLRAYRLIWNEWFRDQNTQDPMLINFGDVESDATLDEVLPVNKRRDYFTTALPEPQRGPAVLLPLGDFAPVMSYADVDNYAGKGVQVSNTGVKAMNYALDPVKDYLIGLDGTTSGYVHNPNYLMSAEVEGGTIPSGYVGSHHVWFTNLGADLSQATSATINQLRQAFAVQALFERDARGGARYREYLKAAFGVNVPDLTVQVPEFLGGASTPLNVNQVLQQSATGSGETPQGTVTGFGKNSERHTAAFTKSFTEPGYVIGVAAIRTVQTYQQGLHRMWSRRSRLDFYDPILDRIGETPILNKEIYVYDEDERDKAFGYQEAFAEYRYSTNYVSGAFRSNYPGGSLDFWTYTNKFDSLPYLSDGFIRETSENIARTVAVQDDDAPQFLVDFWFDLQAFRPMSANSVPAILGGRQ